MKAKVHITLKNGVLDPQGKAAEHTLDHMGFSGVKAVRIGQYIEVHLQPSVSDAEAQVKAMCEKLLANTVIENFRVEVE